MASRDRPGFIRSWTAEQPLPLWAVPGGARSLPVSGDVGPPATTGRPGEPFNFSTRMRWLCEDIASRCAELAHLDVSRILFGFTPARNRRSNGLQARITPLRFRDGALVRDYRGVPFRVQRYFVNGREVLYLMTFCLPRFLNRGFEDKFVTLFHELYHISPAFDGDLRRHHGRCAVHTASRQRYDERMAALARAYLRNGAERARHGFLRLSFTQLLQRHGQVVAHRVPRPKLIPLRD